MPKLACNPIIVKLAGEANDFVKATLSVKSLGRRQQITETMSVTLCTDAAGNVNFDISPLVAAVCRKHFDGDKERHSSEFDNGYNVWKYELKPAPNLTVYDTVLFGAGAVQEADLLPPHLLRRNTCAIHAYLGLPCSFAQITPMDMVVYTRNLKPLRPLKGTADAVVLYYTDELYLKEGLFYIGAPTAFQDPVWQDSRVWKDTDVWREKYEGSELLFYPLFIHPSPADCLRSGAKIYVRYWNSRGAWSYALLDVLYNDLKAKTDYADAWRLDAEPVNGRIYGDRVQTDKEMTYTVTAGRDGLDRLDVDELRDMQRSYCVQVWDIDREAWRDCYVKDATTRNAGGRGQEMTFTLEMPHEYTFTR